jgi:predicted small secreted protein
MKKVIMVIILAICFTLIGCSDVTGPSTNDISSDLRNTTWTKQITGPETITISFGRNKLTMSVDGVSSQYDQQWDYLGGSCCGNGYCNFYNGQNTLEFRYRCSNNGLTISGCNVQSLNGNWTRK